MVLAIKIYKGNGKQLKTILFNEKKKDIKFCKYCNHFFVCICLYFCMLREENRK